MKSPEKNTHAGGKEAPKKSWLDSLRDRISRTGPENIPGETELLADIRSRAEAEAEEAEAVQRTIMDRIASLPEGGQRQTFAAEAEKMREELRRADARFREVMGVDLRSLKEDFHEEAHFGGIDISCNKKGGVFVLEIPDSTEKTLEIGPDERLARRVFAKAAEVLRWKSWPDHAYKEAKALLQAETEKDSPLAA